MRFYLISILILCTSQLTKAQTIEKFSIDSGGASITTGSLQVLYTIGEVNVQEITVGGIMVSEGFINPKDSNTLGIDDQEVNEEDILVYPNPASNFIHIKTNLSIETIEIYDALGKQILKTTRIDSVNISNLSKGAYVLKIDVSNKTINKKIIIQ